METTRNSGMGRYRWIWGLTALALGVAVVASGSAEAFGRRDRPGRDFAEWRIQRMLEEVGASEEQRRQVEAAFEDLHAALEERREARRSRDEVVAALTGESIDREALEELRAEHLRRFDAMSQRVVAALVQAAEALTPDQRAKIAEEMEGHEPRHGGRYWH